MIPSSTKVSCCSVFVHAGRGRSMPIFVRFEFAPDDGGEGKQVVREFDRDHFLLGYEGEDEIARWAREAFMFLVEEWLPRYAGLGYYGVVIQEEEGLGVKILGECGAQVETVPSWAETRGWVNKHQDGNGQPCVASGEKVSHAYTSPNCRLNCRASEIVDEGPKSD